MAPLPTCLPLGPKLNEPPWFKGPHYHLGPCVPTKMSLMKLVTSALSPTLQKHRDSEEEAQKEHHHFVAVPPKKETFLLGALISQDTYNPAEKHRTSQGASLWEGVRHEGNQLFLETSQCAGQCNGYDSYLTPLTPHNTLNYLHQAVFSWRSRLRDISSLVKATKILSSTTGTLFPQYKTTP